MYRKGDFDTPEPDVDMVCSASRVIIIYHLISLCRTRTSCGVHIRPAPLAPTSRRFLHMSSNVSVNSANFVSQAHERVIRLAQLLNTLATLTSEIMTRAYPVKGSSDVRRREFDDLESGLRNWLLNLPDELRVTDTGKRPLPAPHVLVLHTEYYSAVLLLDRKSTRLNSSHSGESRMPSSA